MRLSLTAALVLLVLAAFAVAWAQPAAKQPAPRGAKPITGHGRVPGREGELSVFQSGDFRRCGNAAAGLRWLPVGNHMTDGRWAPSYALLPGGQQALIAGGYSYATRRCVASADIFDERTGLFHRCRGRMATPRDFAPAVLLPDGRILICGGYNDVLGSLWSAELYDRANQTFSPTAGRMNVPRELFQATPLTDGRVLLTGGLDLGERHTVSSAEIYDPRTECFTPTASMANDRFGHAACRLADGRVLVVGGVRLKLGKGGSSTTLASAEVYDPATATFAPAGSLLSARDRPTASLLPDGRVLVIGGQGEGGEPVTTAEIWDPKTGLFAQAPSKAVGVRMAHSALTLPNGCVLAAGGWDATAKATTAGAEIYDPADGTFAPLPALPFASHDAAAVAFADGAVLIAGGKSVDQAGKASSIDSGAVLVCPHAPGGESGPALKTPG